MYIICCRMYNYTCGYMDWLDAQWKVSSIMMVASHHNSVMYLSFNLWISWQINLRNILCNIQHTSCCEICFCAIAKMIHANCVPRLCSPPQTGLWFLSSHCVLAVRCIIASCNMLSFSLVVILCSRWCCWETPPLERRASWCALKMGHFLEATL